MLRIILFIIVGLILLIGILGMVAPKNYDVSRSIVIDAPRSQVFSYLRQLENYNDWSPWAKKDPNMTTVYSGTPGQVGSTSRWEGNDEVGVGEQEITNIVANERIDSEIRFLKPWESTSDGYFVLLDEGGSTKVTWSFKGDSKFPMNIMMMFMNMDKSVGKDFEEGLNTLKAKMEA